MCACFGAAAAAASPSPLPFAPRLPNAGGHLSPGIPPGVGIAPMQGVGNPSGVGPAAHGAATRVGSPGEVRGCPAGLAARSAPALCLPNRGKRVSGSGSQAAVLRLPRLSRRLLHHREGGKALPVPDTVVAEALAAGAGLLRPSQPGSWSLLPSQHAAPAPLALAAADGLNPWRDLKRNHARTHQTASLLPETLFPARSLSIDFCSGGNLFICI